MEIVEEDAQMLLLKRRPLLARHRGKILAVIALGLGLVVFALVLILNLPGAVLALGCCWLGASLFFAFFWIIRMVIITRHLPTVSGIPRQLELDKGERRGHVVYKAGSSSFSFSDVVSVNIAHVSVYVEGMIRRTWQQDRHLAYLLSSGGLFVPLRLDGNAAKVEKIAAAVATCLGCLLDYNSPWP